MPFSKILSAMVDSVEGALGAIFMDSECEYVQYYGQIDSFRQKLMGAYQGILLGLVRNAGQKLDIQTLTILVTEYEHAKFVTKTLKSGYFIVLVMGPESNIGKGLKEIERVAAIINEEIV